MKVLIITPPFYRLRGGRNNWVGVGTGYIASVLNLNDIEVKVYNADHVTDGHDMNLKELFTGSSFQRQCLFDDTLFLPPQVMYRSLTVDIGEAERSRIKKKGGREESKNSEGLKIF